MQLLPKTAAQYSVADVFDPAQNIEGGTHYLQDLLEKYRGNVKLALAACNAGPEMVERYGGIPPFAETQNYVKRILSQLAALRPPPNSDSAFLPTLEFPELPRENYWGKRNGFNGKNVAGY